jgi:hypothetical protein
MTNFNHTQNSKVKKKEKKRKEKATIQRRNSHEENQCCAPPDNSRKVTFSVHPVLGDLGNFMLSSTEKKERK